MNEKKTETSPMWNKSKKSEIASPTFACYASPRLKDPSCYASSVSKGRMSEGWELVFELLRTKRTLELRLSLCPIPPSCSGC